MPLADVLINWLQLKLVLDCRPNDEAAKVSLAHVTEILNKEYKVSDINVKKHKDTYELVLMLNGKEEKKTFTAQSAEVLIQFINETPERYDFK